MLDKLKSIYEKSEHLEEQLSDPSVIADMDKFKKVNKEYKNLQPLVNAYKEYNFGIVLQILTKRIWFVKNIPHGVLLFQA